MKGGGGGGAINLDEEIESVQDSLSLIFIACPHGTWRLAFVWVINAFLYFTASTMSA